MATTKKVLTEENIMQVLNALYEKSLNGIPAVSVPVAEMADDYLVGEPEVKKAVRSMQKNQIAKCTTSGFLTGLGGILTLPVSVPANISSVLYMQIRMIACTAHMAGFDLKNDAVKRFVFACLAGVSVSSATKKSGIATGRKFNNASIKKIPKEALAEIDMKASRRLVSKFGERGVLNLVKLVPVIGAGINGGIDLAETNMIANRAYKMFIDGEFSYKDEPDLKQKSMEAYNKARGAMADVDLKDVGAKATKKAEEFKDMIKKTVSGMAEETVYVTETGKSYHTDITHAGKNPIKISLKEAEAQGYCPCKRCVEKGAE